jgi:hypothetical protein
MVGFVFGNTPGHGSSTVNMEYDTEPTKPKRMPPNAGKGRPKGSLNKVGKAAKDVISEAAELLGGVNRIVAWAKEAPENEKAFWSSIYPKLVPLDTYVSGPDGGPVQIANINVLPVSARVGSDG